MSEIKRYGINEGEVVAQAFGDETVIINLAQGFYYSVEGSASRIWAILSEGFTVEETAQAVATTFGIDREKALADVQVFLFKILENNLMVETDRVPSDEPETTPAGDYQAPDITVHDDIGHLLALDPPVASLQRSLDQKPEE